jgi:hypothetical protein
MKTITTREWTLLGFILVYSFVPTFGGHVRHEKKKTPYEKKTTKKPHPPPPPPTTGAAKKKNR